VNSSFITTPVSRLTLPGTSGPDQLEPTADLLIRVSFGRQELLVYRPRAQSFEVLVLDLNGVNVLASTHISKLLEITICQVKGNEVVVVGRKSADVHTSTVALYSPVTSIGRKSPGVS
jgi:hypothetical protein